MAVYGSMLSRIRQAKRNGTRLHLEVEHVAALLDDDIYALLCQHEAAELRTGRTEKIVQCHRQQAAR